MQNVKEHTNNKIYNLWKMKMSAHLIARANILKYTYAYEVCMVVQRQAFFVLCKHLSHWIEKNICMHISRICYRV